MDSKFETPLQLYVKVPADRGFQYGVHSTLHHTATRLIFRVGGEDAELIKKWANALNMTTGNFTRECSVNTAKELERLEHAYLKSLRSG